MSGTEEKGEWVSRGYAREMGRVVSKEGEVRYGCVFDENGPKVIAYVSAYDFNEWVTPTGRRAVTAEEKQRLLAFVEREYRDAGYEVVFRH